MSRHGYVDDYDFDQWSMIRWRGAVKSAIRGRRGQQFFRDLITALDAMEPKELAPMTVAGDGCVCAMGAVARARGIDLMAAQVELDDEDGDHEYATRLAGNKLGIAEALALEVAYMNDEGPYSETPAGRWHRIRGWAERQLVQDFAQ